MADIHICNPWTAATADTVAIGLSVFPWFVARGGLWREVVCGTRWCVAQDGGMNREDIEPRYFGDQLGYNHAIVIDQPQRWLVVAGHEARADDGSIAAEGDMAGQLRMTVHRLNETLQKSGFGLGDVVQIRIFTTDLADMKRNYGVLLEQLARANCRPTSLLAEVTALSDPAMLVEIEAVAAQ